MSSILNYDYINSEILLHDEAVAFLITGRGLVGGGAARPAGARLFDVVLPLHIDYLLLGVSVFSLFSQGDVSLCILVEELNWNNDDFVIYEGSHDEKEETGELSPEELLLTHGQEEEPDDEGSAGINGRPLG